MLVKVVGQGVERVEKVIECLTILSTRVEEVLGGRMRNRGGDLELARLR